MDHSPHDHSPSATLATAPPPTTAAADLPAEQLEFYIRSAMHQDRSPGNVLVISHPKRMYKVPRGLLHALEHGGCAVTQVETQADRVASVQRIRDAMVALASQDRPLDLIVISGDGSMDHHVLVAAFHAFYPDLVTHRPGEITVAPISQDELSTIPRRYREALLSPLPTGQGLEPDETTVQQLWVLRLALEDALRAGRPIRTIARKVDRDAEDPLLRLAVLATLLPHRVTMRPHGFDLRGLATAPRERLFKGLYPYIRSISIYPAGTAADNAVFAGTPGWGYAQLSKLLTRFDWMDGLRTWMERRAIRQFMDYFLLNGIVVPQRISVVGFDGDWQILSSHAAGGPAAGRFFTADLTKKTKTMFGYLARIPFVLWREGVLGSTVVRIVSRTEDGQIKSFAESHLAEGFYTNRALIAGVASVPTSGPTSFAGQSSLLVVPPILSHTSTGYHVNLRGVSGFWECIIKGSIARTLHLFGLDVGKLAGGGKVAALLPENQVAIKEGEEIRMDYMTMDRRPRTAPIQVSGDPFQASQVMIRSSWAPIPVLGHNRSLLLATTRSVLDAVRLRESYHLETVYIGGVHYFRHAAGEPWTDALGERTGLLQPPRFLPLPISMVQRRMIAAWKEYGAGEFVDTTKAGLKLGRRGRYAHNNDQTAHLVVLKEPHSLLLVRQVRAMPDSAIVYENRTRYRSLGPAWIIHHSQTIAWRKDDPPLLIHEDHYFRNAEEFQRDAPTFFPMADRL